MTPFITICIPSYKREDYIRRLLDSIKIQTFRDYNVCITDNTPDDSIKMLAEEFAKEMPIKYYKNEPPGTMAENWNRSFEVADGEWLKVLHDDDWLATETSLEEFAKAAKETNCKLIFSNYVTIYENDGSRVHNKIYSESTYQRVNQNPYYFFISNYIGNPSTIMMHSSLKKHKFDLHMQWLIDIDFYIRALVGEQMYRIDKCLINIGGNASQATNVCFNNPEYEIPESLVAYGKYGENIVNKPLLFDKWWRLMRNMKIDSEATIRKYAKGHEVPQFMIYIVNFQKKLPHSILKIGIFSKLFMFIAYLFYKARK